MGMKWLASSRGLGDADRSRDGADTSTRTRVRLGIVDVRPGQEGVGVPRVMWLRCLD
ncbi:hypothetical protein ACSHWB_40525 [Lentzea sp. HUAS TT2]|uniref:hypothetical protein n=1 Tax=Lentzea sp. HUAS TT2 TaxID=3447454 RepID=UPI003F71A950